MNYEQESSDDAVIGGALRGSALVIAFFVAIVGGAVWYFNRTPKIVTTEHTVVELPDERKNDSIVVPAIPFTDITDDAGIEFIHQNGATGEKLLPETMGGGCAFLDFDDDGDQDLLLVNSKHWPWNEETLASDARNETTSLYRNDGTGKFENVAAQMGIDISIYGMGTAVGDYDNDGDVDIFISAVGRNKLFRNDGARFTDVTSEAGIAGSEEQWSTSCAWFDYDRDGYLDLFVCNYVNWTREKDIAQDFRLTGIGRAYGPPTAFEGSSSYLYHNNGDGTFEDASKESGIEQTNSSTGAPLGKSLGVAPIDLNQDGWMDIVVANDTVRNFVFVNQKDGTFQEAGIDLGIAFDAQGKARGAMGIDAAYFRNDQCIGVAIANFANEMTGLYVCTSPNQFFTDDAIPTGLGPPTRLDLSFGLLFADFDLDGRLDLLSANGHLENEINQVQSSQHYRQPTRLFWNAGESGISEFVQMSEDQLGTDFGKPIVGRGATYADIDGDGDLDVLITQIGESPLLLRNDQDRNHNFLRLRLISKEGREAIGAMVDVKIGGRTVRRSVMPSRSYLSQIESTLSIGLGKAEVASVNVRWPDGAEQEAGVKMNALTTIRQTK